MNKEVFIPDTNFFISLNFYYNDYGENFKLLINFHRKQIEEEKIIILDKVFDEIYNKGLKMELGLYKENKNKIIDTEFLQNDFDTLAEKHYIKDNEKFLKNKENENLTKEQLIEKEIRDFKESSADLYLIYTLNI